MESLPWCQQLPKFFDKSRQPRSRRPGSVRLASVPSAFRQVSSPGHLRESTRAGTCPRWTNDSPTTLHACFSARGPGLLQRGVPPQASPIQDIPEQGVSHSLWPAPPAPACTRGRTSPFQYMRSNLSQIEQFVKCFGWSYILASGIPRRCSSIKWSISSTRCPTAVGLTCSSSPTRSQKSLTKLANDRILHG